MSKITFKLLPSGPSAIRPQSRCCRNWETRKWKTITPISTARLKEKMCVKERVGLKWACPSSCMRIRAREQWTLRTLRGELNAYGAEVYLQGSLPSTFSFFIINYFSLIARIRKRERERVLSRVLPPWLCACTHRLYTLYLWTMK